MSLRVEEDCLNEYKLHKPHRKRLKILMLNLRFRTLLVELKKVKIQATNWEKLPVTQITDRGAQDTQMWKNFCEPLRKRQSNGKTGQASLAVQGLRICRPVQGTQVQFPAPGRPHVPQSPRATTPEPEPQSLGAATTEAREPRAGAPRQEKAPQRQAHRRQLRGAATRHS